LTETQSFVAQPSECDGIWTLAIQQEFPLRYLGFLLKTVSLIYLQVDQRVFCCNVLGQRATPFHFFDGLTRFILNNPLLLDQHFNIHLTLLSRIHEATALRVPRVQNYRLERSLRLAHFGATIALFFFLFKTLRDVAKVARIKKGLD
jgi:hypothetical protein